jgi:molybdopterin molybdotransferase
MLSISEAQSIVLANVRGLPAVQIPISHLLLGQVLAEDVVSDVDMPPFDKSLMDGFAVRSADLLEGRATLSVIEEITAGQVPTQSLTPGQATRIMTGAPIPGGTDAVVMIERTQLLSDGRVQIEDKPPRPGQNIMPRGREMRRGETVLPAGTELRPQDLGILATVGRTAVSVVPRPRVGILSTGDEIVDPPQQPEPGQIRNGNGPMLQGQVARAGGIPDYLGIVRDREDSLRPLVEKGLQADMFLLSGGVSAGKLDLVPGVLQELGVQAHFHKVELKPGKPVFFGAKDKVLVFGLPGNPVSALVCFELFVRPAIRRLAGHKKVEPSLIEAALMEDFVYNTDRPTYYPASLDWEGKGYRVRPVPWFGSPDLRALTRANAFIVIAAGQHQLPAGRIVAVMKTEGE